MIRILILLLFTSLAYAQEIDYRYVGEPYYPEQFLSKQDSLKWPIVFDISIDVKDIKGLEENNNEFFSKLMVSSFSKYSKEFISSVGDTINLLPGEFFGLYTKKTA